MLHGRGATTGGGGASADYNNISNGSSSSQAAASPSSSLAPGAGRSSAAAAPLQLSNALLDHAASSPVRQDIAQDMHLLLNPLYQQRQEQHSPAGLRFGASGEDSIVFSSNLATARLGYSHSMPTSGGSALSTASFLERQSSEKWDGSPARGIDSPSMNSRAGATLIGGHGKDREINSASALLFMEQRMKWELSGREGSSDSLDDLDSARMVDWVLGNEAGVPHGFGGDIKLSSSSFGMMDDGNLGTSPIVGSPLDPKAPTFTPNVAGSAPISSSSRVSFSGVVGYRDALMGGGGVQRSSANFINRRLIGDPLDELPFEMSDLDAPQLLQASRIASAAAAPSSFSRNGSQSALSSALAGLSLGGVGGARSGIDIGGSNLMNLRAVDLSPDEDILASLRYSTGGGKPKLEFGSAPQSSLYNAPLPLNGLTRQQQQQLLMQQQQQQQYQRGLPIPGSHHQQAHHQQFTSSSFENSSSPIPIDRIAVPGGTGSSQYRQSYPNGSSWAPSSYASSYGGAPSSLSSDEGLTALAARYNASFPAPQQIQLLQQQQQQQQQGDDSRNKRTSLRGRDQSVIGLVTEIAEDGCPVLKVPRLPIWGVEGSLTIPHRVWKKGGTEKADSRHFMVMSYNVLAPLYCTESRYNKSEKNHLLWEARRKKILDEIAFYSPDFVCLQEIPPSDFKEVFLAELSKIGYDGHFQAKKKDHAADGCAIFYLEARFTLLAVQAFAYSDQINAEPGSDLHSRLAPFPNICLVGIFQNRQARSLRVRVVNTHLHWDPAYADTKLLQAAILMEWLERTHRDVPTVIAADLNSRAGEAVVDYLVRGKVAPGALFGDKDFGRFTQSLVTRVAGGGLVPVSVAQSMSEYQQHPYHSGQAGSAPTVLPNPPLPLLRHGTKLASAYDRKDLSWTNKTPDFEGSIDHILYTSGTLSIRDVLGDLDSCGNHPPPAVSTVVANVSSPDISSTSSSPTLQVGAQVGSAAAAEDGEAAVVNEDPTERDDDDVSPAILVSPPPPEGSEPGDTVTPTDVTPTPTPSTSIPPFGPLLNHPMLAGIPYMVPQHQQPQGHLSRIGHLPEAHFPSDHIPLIAWLKWKTVPVGTGPAVSSVSSLGGAQGSGLASGSPSMGRMGGDSMQSGRSRGGRRANGALQQQQISQNTGLNAAMFAAGGTGAGVHVLSSSAPVSVGRVGAGGVNSAIVGGGVNGFGVFDGNRPPLPGGGGGAGGLNAAGFRVGGNGAQVGGSGNGGSNLIGGASVGVGRKPSMPVVGGVSVRRK